MNELGGKLIFFGYLLSPLVSGKSVVHTMKMLTI